MMFCHVQQLWTWLFISYKDWFNTAVTMRLLKGTMGPLGLCKPPWHFKRGTPYPDFSLRTKITTPGKKESATASEQFCSWTEVLGSGKVRVGTTEKKGPGITPFLQQCTAVTTSAEQAQGGVPGIDSVHIPHAQQKSHFTFILLHQCFGTAVGR